jgi:hypothetical protein
MPKRVTIEINFIFEILFKMIAGLILFWFIKVLKETILKAEAK